MKKCVYGVYKVAENATLKPLLWVQSNIVLDTSNKIYFNLVSIVLKIPHLITAITNGTWVVYP